MSYQLTWLPTVLENAGLKVARVPGWENRGRREMGTVLGVLCHHTGTIAKGNMPTLNTLIEGRDDLNGPLAQLGLGRDGTYYVIAAGLCNHAGAGLWNGITDGNLHFIGIEAENSGRKDDSWPEIQLLSYHRGVAAILREIGHDEKWCAGHKEYAPTRKVDPSLDMNSFRFAIGPLIKNIGENPRIIPKIEQNTTGGRSARPTLRRGDAGELVSFVQEKLEIKSDGFYGPLTESVVREFQRTHTLVPDGIVGPKTWALFDAT